MRSSPDARRAKLPDPAENQWLRGAELPGPTLSSGAGRTPSVALARAGTVESFGGRVRIADRRAVHWPFALSYHPQHVDHLPSASDCEPSARVRGQRIIYSQISLPTTRLPHLRANFLILEVRSSAQLGSCLP